MLRPIVLAGTMAVLVVSAVVSAVAIPGAPTVTLDGTFLPIFTMGVAGEQPCLALSSLPQLHLTTLYDRINQRAIIGLGRHTVVLRAGETSLMIDGSQAPIVRAPSVSQGEFWVPLEVLDLFPFVVQWQSDANNIALTWAKPMLLAVGLDKTGPQPRLLLESNAGIQAKAFMLIFPHRLVVDLRGLSAYDFLALDDRENEYFTRIRVGQFQPGVLRVVADLRQSIGYAADDSQAPDGRYALNLNTLIYGVALAEAEEGKKLIISANAKPEWTATGLINPERIRIDLTRATLAVPSGQLKGDGDWLRSAEYRSAGANRVQIMVTLAKPVSCSVTPAKGVNTVLEVQPVQQLSRLAWRKEADGFSFSSTGVIVLAEAAEKYPPRLTFTLYHANAVPDQGQLPAGAISGYSVRQLQAGLAEIDLDLRYDGPYEVLYSPDRHQVSVRFAPSPLTGRVIVLDAGHGGEEPGASNKALGLREKEINLDVTLRLRELLQGAGASVYLTRTDDTYVPLFSRPAYANRLPAEIFLSVHTNAHDDPAVSGVEVFHYQGREEDHRLAGLMFEDMVAALGLLPRGVKTENFAVLRDSQGVAVLIELAFLTNLQDAKRLQTEEFRQGAALAIFRALTRFVRGESPAAGLPGPGLAN